MPVYVVLSKFTARGREAIREHPARMRAAARRAAEVYGARLIAGYVTMGAYDEVAIVEAPDEDTVARMALMIGARGYSTTETLRAFDADQFESLLRDLPSQPPA